MTALPSQHVQPLVSGPYRLGSVTLAVTSMSTSVVPVCLSVQQNVRGLSRLGTVTPVVASTRTYVGSVYPHLHPTNHHVQANVPRPLPLESVTPVVISLLIFVVPVFQLVPGLARSLFLLLMASSENIILEPSMVLPPSVVTNSDSLGGNRVENSSDSVVVLGSAVVEGVEGVVDVDDVVVVVVVETVVVVVDVDCVAVFAVVDSERRPSSTPTSLSSILTPNISRISLISTTPSSAISYSSYSAVMFIFSSSALSHTTFVTFLLIFFGTFSTTCLHSSWGIISHSSISSSSHTFSLTSVQTSSCTFLQSLIGISLQTSSSTNSSSNLVSGPQSSTGLETQDPSTGCERPSLSSISQISSMTVLQTVSV